VHWELVREGIRRNEEPAGATAPSVTGMGRAVGAETS
jgi:hypothetical protein